MDCPLCTSTMEIVGRRSGQPLYKCPICAKYEKFDCKHCHQKFSLWSEYHLHQAGCVVKKFKPKKETNRTKEEIVNAVEFYIDRDFPGVFIGHNVYDFTGIRPEEWEVLQKRFDVRNQS